MHALAANQRLVVSWDGRQRSALRREEHRECILGSREDLPEVEGSRRMHRVGDNREQRLRDVQHLQRRYANWFVHHSGWWTRSGERRDGMELPQPAHVAVGVLGADSGDRHRAGERRTGARSVPRPQRVRVGVGSSEARPKRPRARSPAPPPMLSIETQLRCQETERASGRPTSASPPA